MTDQPSYPPPSSLDFMVSNTRAFLDAAITLLREKGMSGDIVLLLPTAVQLAQVMATEHLTDMIGDMTSTDIVSAIEGVSTEMANHR